VQVDIARYKAIAKAMIEGRCIFHAIAGYKILKMTSLYKRFYWHVLSKKFRKIKANVLQIFIIVKAPSDFTDIVFLPNGFGGIRPVS
jgi:uncharacterized membrane protein (DUF373 family)